jgi:predicted transcriptional regulator
MSELLKTTKMPKHYLMEVLGDYIEVENNIGAIIASTGYKNEYIAKKLNMPISTYYAKRKTKSFAAKDVFTIIKMLEDDERFNYTELELMKSRSNDDVISSEEFKNQLTAMMQK